MKYYYLEILTFDLEFQYYEKNLLLICAKHSVY